MRLPEAWFSGCATSMRFLCWVFDWLCMCTRQGDPQGQEPCAPVYNCRTVERYTFFLGVGSVCGLGPDLEGIHSISLAARHRVAACLTTHS